MEKSRHNKRPQHRDLLLGRNKLMKRKTLIGNKSKSTIRKTLIIADGSSTCLISREEQCTPGQALGNDQY